MKKEIKYYRLSQFGTMREFIHPENKGDQQIITQLTGMKSINSVVRELIRDLSGGLIQWTEVVAP